MAKLQIWNTTRDNRTDLISFKLYVKNLTGKKIKQVVFYYSPVDENNVALEQLSDTYTQDFPHAITSNGIGKAFIEYKSRNDECKTSKFSSHNHDIWLKWSAYKITKLNITKAKIVYATGGIEAINATDIIFKDPDELKIEIENNKKRRKVIAASIVSLCFLLSSFIAIMISGTSNAADINFAGQRVLFEPLNEENFEYYIMLEERYEKSSGFTKAFFHYEKELQEYREIAKELVSLKVEDIEKKINDLQYSDKISSFEEYTKKQKEISNIMLDEEDKTDQYIKVRVKNYSDFEKYVDDFNNLCKKYITKCGSCGGDGFYSITCGSCNGRGKKSVTWYSEGDWGEKSYSSYACPSCNGSGRSGKDCPSCIDGNIYNFEN